MTFRFVDFSPSNYLTTKCCWLIFWSSRQFFGGFKNHLQSLIIFESHWREEKVGNIDVTRQVEDRFVLIVDGTKKLLQERYTTFDRWFSNEDKKVDDVVGEKHGGKDICIGEMAFFVSSIFNMQYQLPVVDAGNLKIPLPRPAASWENDTCCTRKAVMWFVSLFLARRKNMGKKIVGRREKLWLRQNSDETPRTLEQRTWVTKFFSIFALSELFACTPSAPRVGAHCWR